MWFLNIQYFDYVVSKSELELTWESNHNFKHFKFFFYQKKNSVNYEEKEEKRKRKNGKLPLLIAMVASI